MDVRVVMNSNTLVWVRLNLRIKTYTLHTACAAQIKM